MLPQEEQTPMEPEPHGEPTTIYVIDDHPLMRAAIVAVLRRLKPGTEIVEYDQLGSIISKVRAKGYPMLFCLDLKIPNTIGAEGVAKLKRQWPKVPLAVYSAEPASINEEMCIEAGADTYIEKSYSATEVTDVLRGLLNISEDDPDDEDGAGSMTKRQLQLLVMMDRGLSNKGIASELVISEHTVKVHLWRLFRKLGVKNRTSAVFNARKYGHLPS